MAGACRLHDFRTVKTIRVLDGRLEGTPRPPHRADRGVRISPASDR